MTSAACRARLKRSRCGPNGSVMGILPIGEPMDEMLRPRPVTADLTFRSSSSVRSRTLVFQTLRSSMERIDSCASVSSCSSSAVVRCLVARVAIPLLLSRRPLQILLPWTGSHWSLPIRGAAMAGFR